MGRGRGSRSWDLLDALVAALGGVFVAAGALAKVAGGATWLLVVLAAIGLVVLVSRVVVVVRRWRIEAWEAWRALLGADPLALATLAPADLYALGVEQEADTALGLIGEQGHASYRARDADSELRGDLTEALERKDATLIVLSGHSKAGKSRTALEAVIACAHDGWLLVPPPGQPDAVRKLAGQRPPLDGPFVIWLDDLEPWARPDGFAPRAVDLFARWGMPVVLLATAYGKGVTAAGSDGARFQDFLKDLIRCAETGGHQHRVESRPTANELADLRACLDDQVADRIGEEGIGEFMITARELIRRLEHGENAEGRAIVHAAIDCRRAGVVDPIPVDWLRDLYRHYIAGPSTEQHFIEGLRWATDPLYRNAALLRRPSPGTASQQLDVEVYEPYDYLVAHQQLASRPINPATWDYVLDNAPIRDLYAIGVNAYDAGDKTRAERAFRRGDSHGYTLATFNLGVLLHERGDREGAEAAYRRADERGDAGAASNLGVLVMQRGDREGAEAAYRRADERGHVDAAYNLGVLLHECGDREGAEAAWRSADERGHAGAAYNLGKLLRERRDLHGAEAAYRRADERGHADAAHNLGVLLHECGDLDGAQAAWRSADERGHAPAAYNLGVLLQERGDLDDAEAAYRRADERGDAGAASNLGVLLMQRGDREGAEAAYRRGDERGHAGAAYNLGIRLHECGDREGAETAWRRGDERGDADAAYNLGVLLHERGDLEGAETAWRRADERGHAGAAYNLGVLLQERGDLDDAEAAYRRGDERDDADAADKLGVLLQERGDLDDAEAAYRRADERGHAVGAFNLGVLLKQRGDLDGAEAAFARARARGLT